MTLVLIRNVLGFCALVNCGLLLWWFLWFWLAHDWLYGFHGKLFRLSRETFDEIHYKLMAQFKLAIFFFNLLPYIALHVVA